MSKGRYGFDTSFYLHLIDSEESEKMNSTATSGKFEADNHEVFDLS